MADPNDSQTPEGEFELLSRQIAAAIAESDELKAVAVGVLLGATAAVLAQALAKAVESKQERRQRAEVAEILASIAAQNTTSRQILRPRPTPIPWRDAVMLGAANLIELAPEEQPLLSHLSCRSRRTQAVGT